jgi:ferredoxin-type protein NapG
MEEKKTASPSMTRRSFAAGAVGACALLGMGAVKFAPEGELLRPPGAQDESHLLSTCVRCNKCREVCPQRAIGVTHVEAGFINTRTPSMDFKSGYCNFCQDRQGGPLCAEVCPTGAIEHMESGSTAVLGKAELNRDWCLAARGMGCHECVDHCPYHAIELGSDKVPVVDYDACNGCGACETYCISMSSGSLEVGATDRAILVKPASIAKRPEEQGRSIRDSVTYND